MINAIILDNDGVIVDKEQVFLGSIKDILKKEGRELLLEEYITY